VGPVAVMAHDSIILLEDRWIWLFVDTVAQFCNEEAVGLVKRVGFWDVGID